VRESAQFWKELLLDLKRRGLAMAAKLAIADGALGFWQAIEEVWSQTRGQHCWVHKTANVLNKPQDPTEMARLERFVDPSVNPFHGEVSVNEDRSGTGEWRVEYFDDDGGCYVTIFAGPAAERRARDYFISLQSGRLSVQREPLPQ
jgi:transposase-like protein